MRSAEVKASACRTGNPKEVYGFLKSLRTLSGVRQIRVRQL